MATFTANTVSSNDEAYERSDGSFFALSSDGGGVALRMLYGRSGGGDFWYSGWRFQNVTIPQGATISDAKITFTPSASNTIASVTVPIYGNDVDNSANFVTEADVVSRTLTTANASWSPSTTFTIDTPVDTPDLVTVVQEIVDRASWASGNAMTFLLRESAGTGGQDQRSYLFSDDPAKSPLLTINYVSGGGFNVAPTMFQVFEI